MWSWYLHLLQNATTFNFFIHFIKWNWRPLKSWHFEASEHIMTKFKSQGLHIIRIKYWNASGSGPLPHSRPLEHFINRPPRENISVRCVWETYNFLSNMTKNMPQIMVILDNVVISWTSIVKARSQKQTMQTLYCSWNFD